MLGLPFREVWLLDFEFTSEPGSPPVPVCMVARELGSNRLIQLWQNELPSSPPFAVDDQTLMVSYYAPAELGCFLELGWPMPTRVLDLYVEFRNATNGKPLPEGRGLLSALSHYGIPAITSEQKHDERGLVLRGGPWSTQERKRILDYCRGDVDVLAPLLERMLPGIRAQKNGLGLSLYRGRYECAVARMEQTGIPVDTELLRRLRARWELIKLDVIKAVDKDYAVYEGSTFKAGSFRAWLAAEGIDWPSTPSGHLRLDRDTFRDMSKLHPQLEPLKELRHSLAELRLEQLAVGQDGRNRVMLSPFGAITGRNTPSNSQFVFGPSTWVRGLIRPEPGRALAYVDWSAQEVWIAAKLSGDRAMLEAVTSGDPYLTFAKMAGLVPMNATKKTHEQKRNQCKIAMLGVNYGMQAQSLARQTELSVIETQDLLRRLAQTFPTYTAWAEHVVDIAQLTGSLSTMFGWTVHVTGTSRPTTLRNYMMQASGSEMLRAACCLATERGIMLCAPVHDALLVEGPAGEIKDVAAATRAAMGEASRLVLDGLEVATDVTEVCWPDRYADKRGQVMWDRVMDLL
jgi:DNA polymerase-1